MKLRASIWLTSLLLLSAVLLGGCSLLAKNPPGVVSVTLTDQVKEGSMAPANARESFPNSTQLIYASALVSNPQKGTKVEARWTFDKEGQGNYVPIDSSSVTFPEARKENYVAFSLKAVTTFMPGTYKVQILLDDKPAREATFTITEK